MRARVRWPDDVRGSALPAPVLADPAAPLHDVSHQSDAGLCGVHGQEEITRPNYETGMTLQSNLWFQTNTVTGIHRVEHTTNCLSSMDVVLERTTKDTTPTFKTCVRQIHHKVVKDWQSIPGAWWLVPAQVHMVNLTNSRATNYVLNFQKHNHNVSIEGYQNLTCDFFHGSETYSGMMSPLSARADEAACCLVQDFQYFQPAACWTIPTPLPKTIGKRGTKSQTDKMAITNQLWHWYLSMDK